MKKILFMLLLLVMPFSVKAENLKLNKLIIDGKEIELKENVFSYDITIGNEFNTTNIVVEVAEGTNYEIIGNENLVVGNNIVKINLHNEISSLEYTLNVLRMSDDVITLSNNNKLKNISISGYPLGFSTDKLEYNLTIGAEAKLKISYEKESDLSEVYIEGNEKLVNGSVIKVKVIAQSGDVREYKINIKATEVREEIEVIEEDKIDMKLIAYIVSAALISIFLIIINVTGKNTDSKKKIDEEKK